MASNREFMQIRYQEKLLYCVAGEALEQAAQTSCRRPNPGSVEGQVGQEFEQPDVVGGVPAHDKRVGTR